MSDGIFIIAKTQGFEQAIADLKALGDDKLANRGADKSLRAGAKVIAAAARSSAPVVSGKTKEAIKVRASSHKRRGTVKIVAGVGKEWFTGDAFYAAFNEFGHKAGKRKSAGKLTRMLKYLTSVGKDEYARQVKQAAYKKDKRPWVEGKHWYQKVIDANRTMAEKAIDETIVQFVAEQRARLKVLQ